MHSRAATDSSAQSSSSDKPTAIPRHLRRSSSLLALETLIAPSPTLTTSDTLCSVRSGEIPIILSFLATNSTDSLELKDEASGSQLSLCSGLKPGVKELARFSPMAAFFPMSSAPSSVDTATLGSHSSDESNTNHNSASTLFPSNSLVNIDFGPCSPFEHHLDLTLSPSCSLLAQTNSSNKSKGRDGVPVNESTFTIAAYSASQTVLDDIPGGLALSKSEQVLSTTSRNDRKCEALRNDDRMQSSISFTITKPFEDTGSRSPCMMASRSLSTIHFSAPSPQASTTFSPSTSTPLFTPPLTPLSADRTPTQATFLQRSAALRVKASSAQSRGSSDGSASVNFSAPIPVLKPPHPVSLKGQESHKVVSDQASKPEPMDATATEPASPRDLLPGMPCLKHAQWLKDCIVELWIDQEGFRAIRPKFYLASINNGLPFGQERRSSMRKEDPLFSTVAEFLPVTREEHLFHYAALDRPPALHRIAVNGDEERDFVTRQATLGLKENGVFYVQGTEDYKINAPPGSGASRIVRLTWRFEYFVSSRTHGPRGKKMAQGEKIFKPLSFSCTPAFLSPNRAIKVNVLHVMKKTLLPNLIAQKLDPPDLPVLPGSVPSAPSSESLVSIVVSEPPSPSDFSPLTATPARIRAAMEVKKSKMDFTNTTPIIGLPPRKSSLRKNRHTNDSQSEASLLIIQEPEPIPYKRHRAQSESEQRETVDLFATKTVLQGRAANLVRPIIPREELSDAFASRDIRGRHSISMDVVDNVQITVLPPAPRPRPSDF